MADTKQPTKQFAVTLAKARRPETASSASERDLEGGMALVSLSFQSKPGPAGEVSGKTTSTHPTEQTADMEEEVRGSYAIAVSDTFTSENIHTSSSKILTRSQSREEIQTSSRTTLVGEENPIGPKKTVTSEEPEMNTQTSKKPIQSGEAEDNQASGEIRKNPESTPPGDGDTQKRPKKSKTELLIKAMRLYNIILQKRKPLPDVKKGVESLDNAMTISEVLFTARALLTEIPLRKIYLIVKYPQMATYGERLLEGKEGLNQVKEIAEELLEKAQCRIEMARSLYQLLFLGNASDIDGYRELGIMLRNVVNPPDEVLSSFYQDGKGYVCSTDNKQSSSDDDDRSAEQSPPPPPAKKPSSDYELFQTFLEAAENADWGLFFDCLEKGVKITGRLKTGADRGKGDAASESIMPQSPLHVALGTGDFSLLSLHNDLNVKFDKKLANLKDERGTPLLHVAATSDEDNVDNVEFLLQQGADINATDSNGQTVLQCLIYDTLMCMNSIKSQKPTDEAAASDKEAVCSEGSYRSLDDSYDDCDIFDPVYLDEHIAMIMTLISEAARQGQAVNWKKTVGKDGWTVLHVLCAWTEMAGEYITKCVGLYGADSRELRGPDELSLIDTVVLQENLSASDKAKTLKILIQDLKLAPYHATVHSLRVAIEAHKEDGDTEQEGKWSTDRFLRCSQGVNPEVIRRLYDPNTTWTEELAYTTTTELLSRSSSS